MGQKENDELPYTLHNQYIKDLSFENPLPFLSPDEATQPQINIDLKVGGTLVKDNFHETVLHIHTHAKKEDQTLFLLELSYACLIETNKNLQDEQKELLVFVHCPALLFPFARHIVADLTRNGGYPPLYISPIDFYSLYQQKKQKINGTNND